MEEGFIDGIGLLKKKLMTWAETLIEMLPDMILAGVVMFIFFRLAKLAKNLTFKLLSKVITNHTILGVLSLAVYYFVLFEGLFIALNTLDLDQTVTQLLAGAGIIGLGLSFAFQSIAANIISGIIIAAQRPLSIGDLISTNGETGVVQAIDLRVVHLRTFTGEDILVPSKQIIESPLTNYSLSQKRRLHLEVGVSYGEDLERVKEITLNAVKDINGLDSTLPPLLSFRSFDDSSITFELFLWLPTNDQTQFLEARSLVVIAIKKAYDANEITIPFPIRTLDFGIKGGKQLGEVKFDPSFGKNDSN
ncbi:mechanosensitive ion channel family protein [Flammeovirgaceae bacterium SG7u.111]|nr:mechanosensitive ion channel family protein [Flammeovirgaceae bacterium SG7u.132]WPO33026.1 mechanosensitive ion channel family protein [Flammeovirgaceae bacterium SG7u.111]